MKRRITLYIAGQPCDLQDDGLVLLNVALADLTNPAVQRNSYTHPVTLPRTPANDQIFGASFRLDRTAGPGGSGPGFSASRKVPFSIYTAAGEILVAGYAKLESVTREGYEVTLYGGLGELVYNLSYDADGNKRSLASLDYGVDLDFTINASAVTDAWSILAGRPVIVYGDIGSVTITWRARLQIDTYYRGKEVTIRVSGDSSGQLVDIAFFENTQVILTCGSVVLDNTTIEFKAIIPANATHFGSLADVSLTYTLNYEIIPPTTLWDVINFAPAYNGIPGTGFSADKAVAVPADISIPDTKTSDGVTYNTQGGYTLVTLPEAVDEWAAKDLRSYLQRPVLNVWKMLQAIADPANNGGWTIDLSDIDTTAKWPYRDAWLTRPLLPSLGTYKQEAGVASISGYSPWTTSNILIEYTVTGASAGDTVTARMTFRPTFEINSAGGAASLKASTIAAGFRLRLVTFLQAVAYDSNNLKLGAGKTVALYQGADTLGAEEIAQMCGYTPDALNGGYASPVEETAYSLVSSDTYARDGLVTLDCEAPDIDHIEVVAKHYTLTTRLDGSKVVAVAGTALYDGVVPRTADQQCATNHTGTATTITGTTLRSGARITKEMLLTTQGTPADYLLSLCKVFGLYLLADAATKTAVLLQRKSLYQNLVTDLTDRVDVDSVEITPCAFDARWYDLKLAGSGGAFETQYKEAEGVDYGQQRIDTDYDFDAEAKDVLQGAVLKSCAAIEATGKYFAHALNGADYTPGVIMYGGAVQTLWDTSGNGEDFPIAAVPAGTVVPEGSIYPYTDNSIVGRAEFRDKDNKGTDGADCLLLYAGIRTLSYIDVTDDISAMNALNGGTPCWILSDGQPMDVPTFTRYGFTVYLDLGAPRQVVLYGFQYDADKTIYAKAWRSFMRDRLSADGKVLRCRVRLDGLQVGPELLRRFWWYGGSLWALSKIENYSLTTFDLAECEFVQVQDIDAYLNG